MDAHLNIISYYEEKWALDESKSRSTVKTFSVLTSEFNEVIVFLRDVKLTLTDFTLTLREGMSQSSLSA